MLIKRATVITGGHRVSSINYRFEEGVFVPLYMFKIIVLRSTRVSMR